MILFVVAIVIRVARQTELYVARYFQAFAEHYKISARFIEQDNLSANDTITVECNLRIRSSVTLQSRFLRQS